MSGFASIGREIFKLGYQISPIILSGESAVTKFVPGGYLPIIALTESINFVRGLLGGGDDRDLNDYFANFQPLPGSTLIDNQIGMYPFANQAVAANAIITQPKTISLQMICPARGAGAYVTKLATLTALQATLELHNSSGGTYIVATPGAIYTNCVLLALRDISPGSSKQVQTEWQWDFLQPLLSLSDAEGAQNTFMSRQSGGLVTDGALSGASITPGASLTGAAPAVIPAAQPLAGAAIQQPTAQPFLPGRPAL